MKPVALWVVYFPLQLLVSIFCKITAPVACLFVRKEFRVDRVKRLNNQQLGFDREYLWGPFIYWQAHDNAVDEYFWGLFTEECSLPFIRNASQTDYARSWFIRYVCRCLWVWRNTAYGFAYHVFGRPLDGVVQIKEHGRKETLGWWKLTIRQSSWQFQGWMPLFGRYYNNINIGWKTHAGFDRVMFAGRVVGIRKK